MIVKALMRYFSYLFHAVLALFLILLAGIAITSGAGSLRLGMLPWSGDTLNYVLFFGALVGLVTVLLAMKGTLRFLFLLWAFVVFVLLVKGYIFSRYTFQPNEFRIAAFLILASLLSVFGAWFGLRTGGRPKKY
jgi:ABC-type maltose transport system permease subunit